MQEIVAIILGYPEASVRKLACSIFSEANQNNKEVQDFCTKLGALNIIKLVETEKDASMAESLFQAISMLIKAAHFEGKRRFISDF